MEKRAELSVKIKLASTFECVSLILSYMIIVEPWLKEKNEGEIRGEIIRNQIKLSLPSPNATVATK